MIFITIIIIILISILLFKQLKYIKELILPTKKSYLEFIIVILCISVLIYITYKYAHTLPHYLLGFLGISTFITSWLKEGVTSKGFTSMYRYKSFIHWSEIEKVTISNSNHVKITLSGRFSNQTFKFKSNDYNKITEMLQQRLPNKQCTITFTN